MNQGYIWLGSEKDASWGRLFVSYWLYWNGDWYEKETKEALILLTNRIHPTREERGFLKARTKIYQQYF